ncbi:MAG TPA: hypothetical protein VET30_05685 [Pseudoxanthomonas sp.]|nr:hypothetical protein [Pseudoxanthomonas sp.]
MSPPQRMTDSPWFWAYLFGMAALLALALAGPKFGPRQAQIEREYQGRTRAAQNLNGVEPNLEMSTAERTLITLRPLFLGLAALTSVPWVVFWWSRRRGLGKVAAASADASGSARASPSRLLTPDS